MELLKIKTWEVIKALSENPKLKFANGCHVLKISDITKRIVWDNKSGEDPFIIFSNAPGAVDNLHIDWELVPEEVTWQEALEAWVKGESVMRKLDGTSCIFRATTSFAVSRAELIRGQWFIL